MENSKDTLSIENVNKQSMCNEVVLVFLPRQIGERKKHTSWEYFLLWQRCDHISIWFETGTARHLSKWWIYCNFSHSEGSGDMSTARVLCSVYLWNLPQYNHRSSVPFSLFTLPEVTWSGRSFKLVKQGVVNVFTWAYLNVGNEGASSSRYGG